jgi:hypothetical protein
MVKRMNVMPTPVITDPTQVTFSYVQLSLVPNYLDAGTEMIQIFARTPDGAVLAEASFTWMLPRVWDAIYTIHSSGWSGFPYFTHVHEALASFQPHDVVYPRLILRVLTTLGFTDATMDVSVALAPR